MVRSELQALRSHRVNRSASLPLPCSIASSHMDACFVDDIYDFASWSLVSANSQGTCCGRGRRCGYGVFCACADEKGTQRSRRQLRPAESFDCLLERPLAIAVVYPGMPITPERGPFSMPKLR
jgi:hypothetical protein